MAHREAQDAFNRHLPVWKGLGDRVIVICPLDSQITSLPRIQSIGLSEKTGMHACERVQLALKVGADFEEVGIYEWDSLCFGLRPGLGKDTCIWTQVKCDPRATGVFVTPNYPSWPIYLTGKTCARLLTRVDQAVKHQDCLVPDRFVGLLAFFAGVELRPFFNGSYTQNTIESPEHCAEMVNAIMRGVTMVHGIKTEPVFRMAMAARDAFIGI